MAMTKIATKGMGIIMKKKRFFPILLGVWPYLVLGLLWIVANREKHYYEVVLPLVCVLTAVVYILNVINACKPKAEDTGALALTDMIVKLVHIPFYLMIFMIGVMSLVLMVVPIFTFISPIIAIMLAIIDYFLMLTSSAYGIRALILARKDGIISTKFMVLHVIMHFCFVLDIVSAIIVCIKLKKVKNNRVISLTQG